MGARSRTDNRSACRSGDCRVCSAFAEPWATRGHALPVVNGRIVAMGATSPAEDHDPRIDALALVDRAGREARVCYLGTAGGDHEHGMYAFYRAMRRHDCRPTELTFERVVENLEGFVNDQDVFWVAGQLDCQPARRLAASRSRFAAPNGGRARCRAVRCLCGHELLV